jgi:hypothetical protein
MTKNTSILRQAYDAAALFALLNMVALAALGLYMVGGGGVDAQKARRIAAVLRGEVPAPVAMAAVGEKPEEDEAEGEVAPVRDALAESQMNQEILRREGERIKAELDQRLALNNSILLRVVEKRETFRAEQEEAARQREASRAEQHREGFRKQIAIYESLAPKTAVEHLLALPDPDEAARILLEIQTRQARKIVEAAKRGNQLTKMRAILQRVREVAPDRSAQIGADDS